MRMCLYLRVHLNTPQVEKTMISKKCNKCDEKKLLTEFHKDGDPLLN